MEKGEHQNPAMTSHPESGYYAQQTVTSQPDNGYYAPPTVTSQPDNGYYAPPSNNSQRYDYNHPPPYAINSHGYSINSGDISTANVNYTTSDGVPLLESGLEGHIPQAAAPTPTDYLGCAIFVTLCCCLPLGIIAIVFAVESRSAVQARDMTRANDKANTARNLIISGIVLGVIFSVIFGVVYGVVLSNAEFNNNY